MNLADQAIGSYSGLTLSERFYLWVRSRSCPLERVCAEVPASGRILDIGAGSGLLARMLAASAPQRLVLAIDPDPRKIQFARKGSPIANLILEHRDPARPMLGESFDCILLVDVLYLLPPSEQRSLLEAAARSLLAGGRIIVKTMDTRKRAKITWDRAQEYTSIRLIGLTKGLGTFHVAPDVMRGWLEGCGLAVREIPIDRGFVHPHLLFIGQHPVAVG
ncbi:MAG: class I SAM-dependent methyltransferase [Acidobacteria bacterium]|nr:class I SAM-dependent methyltransferase [Acidobacteriota bacterium]